VGADPGDGLGGGGVVAPPPSPGGEAVVHPAAVLAGVEKAGGLEDGEVLGDSGGGEGEELGHLADAELGDAPFAEEGKAEDEAGAAFVGEGVGDGDDGEHLISSFRQMTNCYHAGAPCQGRDGNTKIRRDQE
jgi:hypothetical protein